MILEPIGAEAADALAAAHALAFDHGWSARDIADILASPGAFALAVRLDDTPRAFILCRAIAGEAEVLTLAVAPSHRRRGAARALLASGLAIAAELGAETAFLEVAADNPAAIALYRGEGFQEAGRRAGYYARSVGPAADALVLRRALNSPTP